MVAPARSPRAAARQVLELSAELREAMGDRAAAVAAAQQAARILRGAAGEADARYHRCMAYQTRLLAGWAALQAAA